jgi:multidrug efflux pump subunit AcrA (membrane-fusion protein)
MALDPNIALGVRPLELANPLVQYGQLAQIQNAQNQNQLAQFQLGAARRQEESQNALSDVYQRSINPETGEIDKKLLLSNVAKSRAAHLLPDIQSKLLESESKQATLTKTQQETKASEFKLAQDKLKHGWDSLGNAATPQDAIKKLNEGVTKGYFDFATASAETQQLQNMTPEQYKQYRVEKVLGLLEAKDKLSFMLPKTTRQDIGGSIVNIQDNPMMPGYGMPIAGGTISKTATIADNLAAAKFAFEKANPTLSIQEDPSGMLAVNTRTGVATPVVYGPIGFQAAPAAAPGASMMRQPPAALPGQRTAAIPGMASVLDQTAAPAAMPMPAEVGSRMPGMPVGGKKEAPAKFNDTDMQLAGLAGSLKEFKDEVGKNLFTGAKFVPSGQDTARMTAKYTALLMGVKDLYTLGALTGPDMSIIESQLTNPASWSGKFTSKKGFDEQIKVIEDMLKRSTTNLENTYSRVPKASRKALEGLPGGVDGGISGATTNDPLGLLKGKP